MAKRDNLTPKDNIKKQAAQQLNAQQKKMTPRQFRDAQTRASGAVIGIPTDAKQWKRHSWTP